MGQSRVGMGRFRVESSRSSISCQCARNQSKRKGTWSKWQGARGLINTQDAWEVENVKRGKARQGKGRGDRVE